ncbi:hypothetical protein THRCLA_10209 [Thraustotheca clavata]|uniref:Uncharacterized protein n=1 Tax=Thraustotheca clavata TaxID=74557 RepID=A0A1V9YSF3_9STRA|nr:hypothetical protein THRCLA_10209 [Thraustotheca clavata]
MSQKHDGISTCSKELMMCNVTIRGHIDILKWLHENQGFDCTMFVREAAKTRGRNNIIKYLYTINDSQTTVLDDASLNFLYWDYTIAK